MKKVIWAIDANPELDQTEKTIIQILETLTRSGAQNFQFEPVHIISAPYTAAPEAIVPPSPLELQRETLKLLNAKLSDVNLAGLQPPQVIHEYLYTNAQAAQTLVNYAKQANAAMIVVGTHARKGLARLFLGSFAESLILYSEVPVFAVNPNARAPGRIKHILFPTDFDKESKEVFAKVVELARDLGATITIYNVIIDRLLTTPAPRPIDYENDYLKTQQNYAKKRAEEFLNQANDAGVLGSYRITVANASVSEKIIKYAKKKNIQLIAMAARSGRIVSALAGSTTRQVVRASPWPVWVLRETDLEMRAGMAA